MKRVLFIGILCALGGWLLAGFVVPSDVQAAGTLIVGRGADANSLDPPESQSFEAILSGDWSFDGLVRFDGNSHKIVPALAESWSMSPDGLTWTFKLRKGVKFHDGTTLDAEAVKYNFDRLLDEKKPVKRRAFFAADIKGVRVVDAYTIQLTT